MIAGISLEQKRFLRHSSPLISSYTAAFFINSVTGLYKVIDRAHSDPTEERIYNRWRPVWGEIRPNEYRLKQTCRSSERFSQSNFRKHRQRNTSDMHWFPIIWWQLNVKPQDWMSFSETRNDLRQRSYLVDLVKFCLRQNRSERHSHTLMEGHILQWWVLIWLMICSAEESFQLCWMFAPGLCFSCSFFPHVSHTQQTANTWQWRQCPHRKWNIYPFIEFIATTTCSSEFFIPHQSSLYLKM